MPERVLLVEDRESLRGLLHRALVAGRFEVVAVVPPPGRSSCRKVPPRLRTMRWQTARPRPVPSGRPVTKGSYSRRRTASGSPGPRSCTCTPTPGTSSKTTSAPTGLASMAFRTRLSSTWRAAEGEAMSASRSSPVTRSVWSRASAAGPRRSAQRSASSPRRTVVAGSSPGRAKPKSPTTTRRACSASSRTSRSSGSLSLGSPKITVSGLSSSWATAALSSPKAARRSARTRASSSARRRSAIWLKPRAKAATSESPASTARASRTPWPRRRATCPSASRGPMSPRDSPRARPQARRPPQATAIAEITSARRVACWASALARAASPSSATIAAPMRRAAWAARLSVTAWAAVAWARSSAPERAAGATSVVKCVRSALSA